MPALTNKSPDFSEQTFYIGIDVHRKSWTVTVRTFGLEVAHFNQPPNAQYLAHYLNHKFCGGYFISAYEAGFCGTSDHEALRELGIQNIVINAADLPQTDKQKNNKTDLHDSRAIARYLEKGLLNSIHIMSIEQQERRALFRCREAVVKDSTRAVNRVRSFLYFFGIDVPEQFKEKGYISKQFLNWLDSVNPATQEGKETLQHYVDQLIYLRKQVLEVTKKLRKSVMDHFKDTYTSLLSVPGIGSVTAMALLAETGDLSRFKNPDDFSSYLGLVPAERRTGETVYNVQLQPRCNTHLRPLLIEASWLAIRQCPVLLSYYRKHVSKNNKKAIIKVARKLALIAKAVAISKRTYQADYTNR
jgi:transposase